MPSCGHHQSKRRAGAEEGEGVVGNEAAVGVAIGTGNATTRRLRIQCAIEDSDLTIGSFYFIENTTSTRS